MIVMIFEETHKKSRRTFSPNAKKFPPPKSLHQRQASPPPTTAPPPNHNTSPPNSLPAKMPLDTSTYSLALLRLDGRRWNELRRLTAQVSTQAAADGSSYLEMGNTKVICTVTGPAEAKGTGGLRDKAEIKVEVALAGFSGVDRKRTGRNDK